MWNPALDLKINLKAGDRLGSRKEEKGFSFASFALERQLCVLKGVDALAISTLESYSLLSHSLASIFFLAKRGIDCA